jgi:hypothetical protein
VHFLLLPSFNLLPTVRAILRALTSGDRFVPRHTVIALSAYGGSGQRFRGPDAWLLLSRGSPEQTDSASSLDYKGEGCIVRGGVRRMAGPK